MKQLMIKGLAISLVTIPVAYAKPTLSADWQQQLNEVVYQVKQIAINHRNDKCAADVLQAVDYLNTAGHLWQQRDLYQARVSLAYGYHALKDISTTRRYCAGLSTEVSPCLSPLLTINKALVRTPALSA